MGKKSDTQAFLKKENDLLKNKYDKAMAILQEERNKRGAEISELAEARRRVCQLETQVNNLIRVLDRLSSNGCTQPTNRPSNQ